MPTSSARSSAGGAEKVTEAGAVTVGGHTIDDKEPKFGLSVFGVVHPDKVVRNRGALVGDVLFLTKPIGTGLIGTALKNGLEDEDSAREVIESMAALNRHACEAMVAVGRPRGHRRHRLRTARPPSRDGRGERLCGRAGPERGAGVSSARSTTPAQGVMPGRTADVVAWADEFSAWES